MRILALDQSSRISGYAIFNNKELESYGKFSFDDENIGIRLNKIRNKVKQLILDNNIEKVIFEDIQLQGSSIVNVSTFKILAEVFGVIYELLTEMNIPHEEIVSTSWKSTLKIKGKNRQEQKRNAQLWVTNTYGIKPTQDECDAICIGNHYLYHNDESVLAAFDWSD